MPEVLVYDFTLAPGDTFIVREDTNHFIVLDSISDTIINPFFCEDHNMPELLIEKPKVFYFNAGGVYGVVWVEGIGSLAGLLKNYHEWGGGVLGRTLLCHHNQFQERDFHYIYCEEPNPCQGFVVSNVEKIVKEQVIKIYPNPTSNMLNIEYRFPNQDKEIHVYDLNGKEQLYTKNTSTININHLPKGIYFIKIAVEHQIFTKKIIKQ